MSKPSVVVRHAMLRAGDLDPHPIVQRSLFDHAKARSIRDSFDPGKLGMLSVSLENGRHYVWDGMHRTWAIKETCGPDFEVFCEVLENMPVERLAEMFLGRNNGKPIRAVDKFKIAVIAGQMPEAAIDRILRDMGMTVDAYNHATVVRAPVSLRVVFNLGGEPLLRRTLRVARDAWAGDSDAFDGDILKGVGRVLHQFSSEIDDVDLAHKLARHGTAGRMIGAARDHSKAMGVGIERAISERVLNIYNKGKRSRAVSIAPSSATRAA